MEKPKRKTKETNKKWHRVLEVRKRRDKMVRGIMYQIQLSKVPWYTVNLHPLIILKKKFLTYFLCVFSQLDFWIPYSVHVFFHIFFRIFFPFHSHRLSYLLLFHFLPLVWLYFLWDLLSKWSSSIYSKTSVKEPKPSQLDRFTARSEIKFFHRVKKNQYWKRNSVHKWESVLLKNKCL